MRADEYAGLRNFAQHRIEHRPVAPPFIGIEPDEHCVDAHDLIAYLSTVIVVVERRLRVHTVRVQRLVHLGETGVLGRLRIALARRENCDPRP